jgi:signal transduction histidine kinase
VRLLKNNRRKNKTAFLIFGKAVLFFLMTCSQSVFGQHIQIRTLEQFKIDEGLIQNNNSEIEADSEGKIWVSGPGGTQWSNGKNFFSVEKNQSAKGLPTTERTGMLALRDGRMVFATKDGLSFYSPQTHRFEHHLCSFFKNEETKQILFETPTQFWIACYNKILLVNRKTYLLEKTIFLPDIAIPIFRITDTLSNTLCVFADAIVLIDIAQGTVRQKIAAPAIADVDKKWGFHLLTPNSIAIYISNQIYTYDFLSLNIKLKQTLPAETSVIKPGCNLFAIRQKQDRYIIAFSNHLFSIDFRRDVHTKYTTNKGLIFDQGNFTDICQVGQTIWASTSTQGVLKLNLLDDQVRYFGTSVVSENFIKCMYVDKRNNAVLAGTYEKGILVFDTLGKLRFRENLIDKQFPNGKTISAIIDFDANTWLIAVYETGCIYKIYRETWKIERVAGEGKSQVGYYTAFRKLPDGKIMLGENKLIFDGTRFCDVDMSILGGIVSQTKNGALWLFHGKTITITFPNGTKKITFAPNDAWIKQLVEDQQHQVWAASDRGLLVYSDSGTLIRSYTRKDGLPDDQIYAIAIAQDGTVWISHNKGISYLKQKELVNFPANYGLQENEFNSACVFQCADGQLFFGGTNGITAFYPNDLLARIAPPKIEIAAYRVNDNSFFADSAYWNFDTIDLSYAQHILTIDFFATGVLPPSEYAYQYRVIGVDQEWVNAGKQGTLRYQLRPGIYQIELAAEATFDPQAKPQKIIVVRVRKPWYQSFWFITCVAVFILFILWQLLNYLNHLRYRKQLQELKIQQELENERQRISRDLHDNMGAYTSALIANVQQLENKIGTSSDLQKMQSNAEQILSSLRETIWVLNNREVTMQSFSDTFKNYCFKVLRNFEDIAFDAEENFSGEEKMSAARAIHLQKILQEGIQNTIKHTQATQIRFVIDNTNGLKLRLEDNGAGFLLDASEKGHGLENMNWRAAKADCRIEWSSVIGKGTTIIITEIKHK